MSRVRIRSPDDDESIVRERTRELRGTGRPSVLLYSYAGMGDDCRVWIRSWLFNVSKNPGSVGNFSFSPGVIPCHVGFVPLRLFGLRSAECDYTNVAVWFLLFWI